METTTKKTLRSYLFTQDMGEKGIDKICENVLFDTFDPGKDPITTIIVNAFVNNDNGLDIDSMIMDIDYAINQLQKVKMAMENEA